MRRNRTKVDILDILSRLSCGRVQLIEFVRSKRYVQNSERSEMMNTEDQFVIYKIANVHIFWTRWNKMLYRNRLKHSSRLFIGLCWRRTERGEHHLHKQNLSLMLPSSPRQHNQDAHSENAILLGSLAPSDRQLWRVWDYNAQVCIQNTNEE